MMHATIVTRTQSLYEGPCEQVVVPAESGEVGILSGHEPVLGVLGKGQVRVTTAHGVEKFQVERGIYSVDSNLITVAAQHGSVAEG